MGDSKTAVLNNSIQTTSAWMGTQRGCIPRVYVWSQLPERVASALMVSYLLYKHREGPVRVRFSEPPDL